MMLDFPLPLASDPLSLELYAFGALALFLTSGIGFVSGLLYARWSQQFALQRASQELSRLFRAVLRSLDTAEQACGLLEKFPNLFLTEEQAAQFDGKRKSLLETAARIVESRAATIQRREAEAARAKARLEQFSLAFERTPEDLTTKLPDRTAFETNLAAMLTAGNQSGQGSGLLLVKIDKYDHLKTRFGWSGAEVFLQKMAGLLCRTIREADLVCRIAEDTFAVLLPAVDAEQGQELAGTVRTAVRQCQFRRDESGPEVLVTASFGYTSCLPDDHRDIVLSRAGAALAESQRRGRNQLHVHNGNAVAMCATA